MTKKIIALLFSALTMLAVTACSKNDSSKIIKDDTSSLIIEESSSNTNYEGSLEDLMTAVYEKNPVEIMLEQTTAVDLTNADMVNYYLGLSDASNVSEAVFSEPSMSSQAYSVCLVRAKDGADIEELKESIIDGINPRKWICVGANKIIVSNYGNVIILIMVDNSLSETLNGDLYNAFSHVVGGTLGNKLERNGE